ncbi:signal peptidase II [Alphaproteobacteria bacterium]|jgi:signal peptidase II|nr:signal peptidase II [Alphaproteobacteria bacterium]MDB2636831.1 signal peptidase II [Alphaproteobacteria bacterium]MDC0594705.1 signal peptidase II [Alphaproteobacteria bacterium]|tara:strand:+ start:51 stop:530 length:480 start_codon:yes stop_codon:yes gene_type:complete
MAKLSIKNNISIITTFFLIIFFDQLTKILVIKNFQLYESLSILPFFNLTFIVNYGFAFGFLNNPSLNQIIVILVIFSIIAYFLYLLIKTQDQFFRFSLILVLSGAVGNFIDRVLHGFVIDFIDIYLGSYHWPAFNLADSSITLGFILIMFNILFLNKKI